MSTFSIGTTPQAIAQGYQSDVTLYNEGPDTVWVDENTSVTPISGFAILPGDSAIWQAGRALYAVARALPRTTPTSGVGTYRNYSGKSTVKVTPTGQAFTPTTLHTRAIVSHFDAFQSGEFQGDMLNVSTYDHIDIKIAQSSKIVPPTSWSLILSWYDENALLIREELRTGWANKRTTVRVLTEGSYLAWRFVTDDIPTTPSNPLEPTFSVIGHTRPDTSTSISLSEAYYYNSNDSSTLSASASRTGGKVVYWDFITHVGRRVVDTSVKFLVPDLGSLCRVKLTLASIPTSTTTWGVGVMIAGSHVGSDTISSFSGSNTIAETQGDLFMPVGQQAVLTITGTKPTTGAGVDINLSKLALIYRN